MSDNDEGAKRDATPEETARMVAMTKHLDDHASQFRDLKNAGLISAAAIDVVKTALKIVQGNSPGRGICPFAVGYVVHFIAAGAIREALQTVINHKGEHNTEELFAVGVRQVEDMIFFIESRGPQETGAVH